MTRRSFTLNLNAISPERIDPSLTVGDQVMVLGSTVRGLLRHAAVRLAASRGESCVAPNPCGCSPCRLFGGPDRPGRLEVRSSVADGQFRDVTHVAIDRRRRTADRQGRRLSSGLTAVASHSISVSGTGLEPDDEAFLELLLGWVELTGLQLGQKRSAGFGWSTVSIERPSNAPDQTAHTAPPDTTRATNSRRSRRRLLLTTREPIRLSSLVQRSFYRDSDRTVPPNTLRGALGWALAEQLGDDAARWLMVDDPIRIGPGWPIADDVTDAAADPTLWLGRYRCRGRGGADLHDVDLARAQIEAAVVGTPLELVCSQCGSSLKPWRGPSPSYVVFGQTEIDPKRTRAAEHQLRFQAAVAPGTRFAALVEATEEQFEVLGALGTIFVGGNRRRGLGATEIELQMPTTGDRGFTPIELDGIPIIVAGLATDAFAPTALRPRLESAGFDVVAANVRTVERGGWDTMANRMRPVRRLLQAGSWLALRSDEPVADDFERLGDRFESLASDLFDPTETDPIWMVPRPVEAP